MSATATIAAPAFERVDMDGGLYGMRIRCACGKTYETGYGTYETGCGDNGNALRDAIRYSEWGVIDSRPACPECLSAHLDIVCGEAN